MGRRILFLALVVTGLAVWLAEIPQPTDAASLAEIDSGDTAWMLVSSAFVLLMTPGLAFFYGGMVHRKHIISTMLQSFVALGVVTVLWVLVGFSLCFGESVGGIIGNPLTHLAFRGVGLAPNPDFAATIPFLLFALFQLKFAIITPALITGSMAGRIRFRSYILFMALFSLLIYAPLAHMTWHPDGLLRQAGVLDFAGGTVVHMSAGLAALAGALFLGRRTHAHEEEPANIPFVILGTGMLWFGWFGFNAGSALGATADAVLAFANTNIASATAMITWMFYERFQNRKMSAVGACIGAIVGLVAITPAAGFVTPGESLVIGGLTALLCNAAMSYQRKTRVDDTLEVFPSHGVGGMIGMVMTALFAGEVGLLHGGGWAAFGVHLLALVGTAAFAFGGAYGLFFLVNAGLSMRVTEAQEQRGLDLSQHGESLK